MSLSLRRRRLMDKFMEYATLAFVFVVGSSFATICVALAISAIQSLF
jgi:hypothetical protein